MSLFSYGAKAFINKHSLFMQYLGSQSQFNLGYVIPIKKGTQFISHFKLDSREKKSQTILGFKQKYGSNDIMSTINSKGEISTSVTLRNPTFGLKLCALVDYMKEKYSFGYGIMIGHTGM